KLDKATRLNAKSRFNKIMKVGNQDKKIKRGIIAIGINFAYVREAVDTMGFDGEILKLATTYPIPDPLMASFMKDKDEVLIIEEGEPVTEVIVRSVAQYLHMEITIKGKSNGILPRFGELNPDLVAKAVSEFTGRKYVDPPYSDQEVPKRTPALCAGCPHRATYYAIHKALKDNKKGGIVAGDRGCYNQGAHAPLSAIDTCICMGASIAMASGFYHANVDEPIVAVIGDGTFFHGGLPSLLNAVHNYSNITVAILDNSITGMTGHQPNPGTGMDAMGRKVKQVDIFDVVKALGVDRIFEVNAFETNKVVERFMEEINMPGPSVVISKAPCAIVVSREKKGNFQKAVVDEEKCKGCKLCINTLGCPAFAFEEKKLVINDLCTGCGLCATVCPFDAITAPVVSSDKQFRTHIESEVKQ
ncbi:MAG TPA: indolepyruvate ferredoxin oxidoreductase subunit alpha, partial [Euryarchaeota archaeon]|nr:indolepyruvate ferredoxin oxidoreductase subunit alpha [Euryarchaeota archaeon]